MSRLAGWKRQTIHAPGGQSATFVELFFDLVFVFALTEVTHFAVTHLDPGGVARTILIFWLIWWAWSQWTWALNPADTEHGLVRIGTLAATAIAFAMAVSVEDAFNADGALWFVVPYILVRLFGLALYARVATERAQHLAAVRTFAALSMFGFAVVLIGGFADPDARVWWWLAAVVLDLLVAGRVAGFEGWHIHPEHFAERHGLFVIIALGESLIVAAAGVAGAERTAELAAVAIGAIAVTCLLWWTYFGWLEEGLAARLRELKDGSRSSFARDAYSLCHLLIIAGVVAVAVGLEELVAHPAGEVGGDVLAALGVGVALFLGASAAAWARAGNGILWARIVVPAGLGALLVLVAGLTAGWILALVVGSLALIVAIETLTRSRTD